MLTNVAFMQKLFEVQVANTRASPVYAPNQKCDK